MQIPGTVLHPERGHINHALVVHRVLVLHADRVQKTRGELGEGGAGGHVTAVVGQPDGHSRKVSEIEFFRVPGDTLVVQHGARDDADAEEGTRARRSPGARFSRHGGDFSRRSVTTLVRRMSQREGTPS